MNVYMVARDLLRRIQEAEAAELADAREKAETYGGRPEDWAAHAAPGEVARACPHVLHDVMDRLHVGDCGWIIPIRYEEELAVLTYHPGEGWTVYVGDDIPEWIAAQLT